MKRLILALLFLPSVSHGFFFVSQPPVTDSEITPSTVTATGEITSGLGFVGPGDQITNLDPAQMDPGTLGTGVLTSATVCTAGQLLEGGGQGCQAIGMGGHGDGANCSAGNAPLGMDSSGGAQGCFDVTTQAELTTHIGVTDAHFDHADDLTELNTQLGTSLADGAHTAAGHGDGADCSAGNAPLGVDANGAVTGCFDVTTQAELTTHTGIVDAHFDHADTLAELNTQIGSGLVTGAHTVVQSNNQGKLSTANICLQTPGEIGDFWTSSDDGDMYLSTAATLGSVRNGRTGSGACS